MEEMVFMLRKIFVLIIFSLILGAGLIPNVIGINLEKSSVISQNISREKMDLIKPNYRDLSYPYNKIIHPSEEDIKSFNTPIKSFNNINCKNFPSSNTKWTWMFYNDADFTNGYDPFEWFSEEAYSGENLDVIMLQDTFGGPAKYWYIDQNHNPLLLENLGEVNMGDSQTLSDFIEYSKTNYPADRYLISFYNHGGGWTGACVDDTDKGWLTMDDIQKALTDTGGADIVCFTAPCLMGAFESVYELRDCVDVYIGSEELSGYAWWGYIISDICDILNQNPDLDNIAIGEQIINVIEADHYRWDYAEAITMSAIRTDKINQLSDSIDIIAHDFYNNKDESYYNIQSIYNDVQYFSNGGILDIYDLVEKISTVETDSDILQNLTNVMNSLIDCIIAECHGTEHPDAHGLTIYFPKNEIDSNYADSDYGLDFAQDAFWDEFFNDFISSQDSFIDQKQTELNSGGCLCGNWDFAQGFVPTRKVLTKIKLPVLKKGVVNDLKISIRNELDGNDLTVVSKQSSDISTGIYSWTEFDFKDIDVNPGELYYIVMSTTGGDNQENFYFIGAGINDPYPQGDAWMKMGSADWIKIDDPDHGYPKFDFCFKTYGRQGKARDLYDTESDLVILKNFISRNKVFNKPFISLLENYQKLYHLILRFFKL